MSHIGPSRKPADTPTDMVTKSMVTGGMVTEGIVTGGIVTTGMVTNGMVLKGMVTRGKVTKGMVTKGVVTKGWDLPEQVAGRHAHGHGAPCDRGGLQRQCGVHVKF